MNITLGPAMRVLVYSAIIGVLSASMFYAGWSTHKFYGVSNELAINKSDAIESDRINKKLEVEIDEINKQQATFKVTSDCDSVTFDSLLQQSDHKRP